MKALNLNIGRKLLLLGFMGVLLFLVPFGFYVRQVTGALQAAQQEQAGIPPAIALLRIVQLTQQHRGLFGGGLKEQRIAKQAEADAAYAAFTNGFAKALPGGQLADTWSAITNEWGELTKAINASSLAAGEGLARHNQLIDRELELVVLLAEHHGLLFDADPAVHHLVTAAFGEVPQLTEALGRSRAYGSAYLTQQKLDYAAQAPIAALVQTARLHRGEAAASIQKAAAKDPALRATLADQAQAALGQADQAFGFIQSEILRGDAPTMAPAEYFATMTKKINAIFDLERLATEQLQHVFEARMATQVRTLSAAATSIVVAAGLVIALGVVIARSIARPIRASMELAQRVAQGDLTVRLESRATDEMGKLQQALSDMVVKLRELLGEVVAGAHAVSDTSAQIAEGNADLSQRTEEQASTLEETASSMEELTSTVSQSAENARLASELALQASGVASKGGTVIEDVVCTMREISAASGRIEEIIGVIDGIAFQTNILALNAAVEAARAGDQGRGFAVVAAEVRNLAQRSAAAAKEIKALIGDSVQKVRSGTELVDSAGQTMNDIVASVQKVNALVAEIAAATREQSAGIGQVNTAVTQMDRVVQQNATLVDEAAAATESMKQQAARLLQLVSRFSLDSQPRVPSAAAVQRPAVSHAHAPAPIKVKLKAAPVLAAALDMRGLTVPTSGAQREWQEF